MNIIFDFDGTLADSKECSILATRAAFKAFHLEVPNEEEIAHYMGIPIEQSFKEMAKRNFNVQEFKELLSTFRSYYQQYENETLQLFPGIEQVLQELQKQHVQCFVVSSKKTDVLRRNLQALKIETYFNDLIGSDQVQHYKPHPEGIYLLLERYKLQAKDCVMIGDAIFDIQMGKAANCQTCAVTWGSHSKETLQTEQPDFIVDDPLNILRISVDIT